MYSNNVFKNNLHTNPQYNYTNNNNRPTYPNTSTQQSYSQPQQGSSYRSDPLGSYRTDYRYEQLPSSYTTNIPQWKDSPFSIAARQNVLHLSLTELKVEDYFNMRRKGLKAEHEAKIAEGIKNSCLHDGIVKNTEVQLLPFSREPKIDLMRIRNPSSLENNPSHPRTFPQGGNNNYQNTTHSYGNHNETNRNNASGAYATAVHHNNGYNSNDTINGAQNIFNRTPSNAPNNPFRPSPSTQGNTFQGSTPNLPLPNTNNSNISNNIFKQAHTNNTGTTNNNTFANNNTSNPFAKSNTNNSNSNPPTNNPFANKNIPPNTNNMFVNSSRPLINPNMSNQPQYPSNNNQPQMYSSAPSFRFQSMPTPRQLLKQKFQQHASHNHASTQFRDYFNIPSNSSNNLHDYQSNNAHYNLGNANNYAYQYFSQGMAELKQLTEKYQQNQQFLLNNKQLQQIFQLQQGKIQNKRLNDLLYDQQTNSSQEQCKIIWISDQQPTQYKKQLILKQKTASSLRQDRHKTQKRTQVRIHIDINWFRDESTLQPRITKKSIDYTCFTAQLNLSPSVLQALIRSQLRMIDNSIRSDCTFLITNQRQQAKDQRTILLQVTGEISQRVINIDSKEYQYSYDDIVNNHLINLTIKNQHGSVLWLTPIPLLPLDFNPSLQPSLFKIDPQAIQSSIQELNSKCKATFNTLPNKFRQYERVNGGARQLLERRIRETFNSSEIGVIEEEEKWWVVLQNFNENTQ